MSEDREAAGEQRGTRKKKSALARVREAREQFEELTGIRVEAVSGMERSGEGWTVTLEALELERVPDSVSLLATYTVELDDDGDLIEYRRLRRYTRGRADAS
ncbi:Gas vesicle synthesis protein GvpO [Marinactinospora thermotolerans DSM 45154]|uniref:Gas vesicle synthesis protein GvpO n=2 Tax=Marinactinospora thermotolerans TaxID=531310 RepID=A0A1T4P1V5_9ACTN|nr:gas vesicle protein GvpO [Marinactinospora thermotolerans]AET51870.1 putative gas vesicle synthesis protein [Marinactinospora thermotolerans]SJZ85505.1 Gas vesicle synthesis protein GvpO [Marinactinospora thermotolerans DSM 45154]